MRSIHSLRLRIILSFFFQGIILCICFAAAAYYIASSLERQLYYNQLDTNADWYIKSAINGADIDFPHGIKLYQSSIENQSNIPEYLHDLEPGSVDLSVDGRAIYVITRQYGDQKYMVTHDHSRLEKKELFITELVAAGIAIALLVTLGLGLLLADKVIAPLSRLTGHIGALMENENEAYDPVHDKADDEINRLTACFDQYSRRVQGFLSREREFTADISHELRTYSMLISSACEILRERDIDKRSREIVDGIMDAAGEMQEFFEVFLALAREPSGQATRVEGFPVCRIIREEIESDAVNKLRKNEVSVTLDQQHDLLVTGVPQLFRAAIRNLLLNALRHTKQGRVSITVTKQTVEVEDTGLGIPEESRAALFTRHAIVNNSEQKGEGLGLSIVKRVCDYHGWAIHYEPGVSRGSHFILTIGDGQGQRPVIPATGPG